jgi:transcriptional regulator with PAS, ATPase and Fis domain
MRATGCWLPIFLCFWMTASAFAEGQPRQQSMLAYYGHRVPTTRNGFPQNHVKSTRQRGNVLLVGAAGRFDGTAVAVPPPRWHQRWPFRIALLGLALATLAAVFRLCMKLRQGVASLETMIGERTAELLWERERLNAANQELVAAKEEIQREQAQLLSVLDELRVGIIVVDPRQQILFVNEATRRLLSVENEVIGSTIERVLPIQPEVMTDVQMLIRRPRPRTRLTVRLNLRSDQQACAELEVRLDPRNQSNSILYLYDVAETYELKQAQPSAESNGTSKALASLVGQSAPMRSVHAQIRTVAAAETTVLIEGETGTGKEMVARAIHDMSRRKARPFVAINCAGLTESLLASQLFGHRRGSFTGAVADHVGLFEAAQGGTLLLDEVGDMPMSVQTHLLRVLQEREILRLGESKPRRIDVRVLVATHRSLEQEVAEGNFREDLLYRILVVRMSLPPLRSRLDDIPLLATAFMEQFCTVHQKPLGGFSRDAMQQLMSQRWPGNVRELRATIEWAVLRATGPTIRRVDLPSEVVYGDIPPPPSKMVDERRRRLVETLTHAGGNRSVAARMLGVSRSTLYRQLAALEGGEGRTASPSPPEDDDDDEV